MAGDHLAPTLGAPSPPDLTGFAGESTTGNDIQSPPQTEVTPEDEGHGATEADITAANAIVSDNAENDWTILVVLYALNLTKKCRAKRKIHDESSIFYQRRFNIVTIFLIVLGVLITAISQLPLSGVYFKYVIGILGLASTALAAIFKFLKYEALQAEHRLASQAFLDLNEEIHEQCILTYKRRINGYIYLSRISKQFRNIVKQAPNPPKEVLEMLKTTNPDPDSNIEFGRYPRPPPPPIVEPGQPVQPGVTESPLPPLLIPPSAGLSPDQSDQQINERLKRRLLAELQSNQNDLFGGGTGWDMV